jgi:hypothetical protein
MKTADTLQVLNIIKLFKRKGYDKVYVELQKHGPQYFHVKIFSDNGDAFEFLMETHFARNLTHWLQKWFTYDVHFYYTPGGRVINKYTIYFKRGGGL